MERVCIQCGTKETSKWFTGPLCRKCYRNQPNIKERENKSRFNKIDHYREVARVYSASHKGQNVLGNILMIVRQKIKWDLLNKMNLNNDNLQNNEQN